MSYAAGLHRQKTVDHLKLDTARCKFPVEPGMGRERERHDIPPRYPHSRVLQILETLRRHLVAMDGPGPQSLQPASLDIGGTPPVPEQATILLRCLRFAQTRMRGQSRGKRYMKSWTSSIAQTSGPFSHAWPGRRSEEMRTGRGSKTSIAGSSLKWKSRMDRPHR